MQSQTETLVRDGVVESFWAEFTACWRQLPNTNLFLILLGAWLVLFQVLGNGTFGYTNTPSIFKWLWVAYNSTSETADDTHGNVVPFVVLWLMWWKRKELLGLELRSWIPGIFIVALALVMHLLGYLVQQPRISVLALFLGIYGFMGMAWGPGWLRHTVFPFVLFVFAMPFGSQTAIVTFPLRILSTSLVEFITRHLFGMDVVRIGSGLYDATGTFQFDVAPACSGIRSLMAVFLICTTYGYVLFRCSWRWLVMIVSAFPLAVLGNMLRLLVIVVAGDLMGQEAGMKAHDSAFFSMIPYVPAILGAIYLGRWMERWNTPAEKVAATEEAKP